MMELMPFSGDCKRPISFKTIKATWDRHEGTSRMILVSTAPGSAALQIKQIRNRDEEEISLIKGY